VSIGYLDLVDYLAIAVEVTGLSAETIARVAKLHLADSALHAPAAGFGETEFYPDFVDKAAVLVVRLAKNHPLPDGNKRAAWVSLRLFIDINGWRWSPMPDIDEAERAVLAIASGEWTRPRPPTGSAIAWLERPSSTARRGEGPVEHRDGGCERAPPLASWDRRC
jgi:death on curing protein